MFNPTAEQETIRAAIHSGKSIACKAFAGSAKTTTAQYAEEGLNRSILNVAFNKRNALDFEEKMPKGTTNKTFNALGHAACMKLISGRRIKLLSNYSGREKTYNIMSDLSFERDDFPDMAQLISLLKNNSYVPPKAINFPAGVGTPDTITEIVEDYNLDMGQAQPEAVVEAANKILLASINQTFLDGLIDFDDQLYISTLWGAPFGDFDLTFVDEAQDLSPIQHLMVRRLTRSGKRQLVIAGDPHQAIYAFRGALCDSFDRLVKEYDLPVYPLSISFRCPKAVVREAQTIVQGILPWSEAPEGECIELDREEWKPSDFQYGDAILCRNTRPLIPLFYRTLSEGIGAKVLGSEIGKGLIRIVKDLLKRNPGATTDWLIGAIKEWRQSQVLKYTNKKQPLKAAAKAEQADVLIMLSEREPSPRAVIDRLSNMFSDRKAPVTFSTIHKAKGLEWPRVWFLNQHLIPSRYATTQEELQQERNLKYVAITRAQRSLRYITREGE